MKITITAIAAMFSLMMLIAPVGASAEVVTPSRFSRSDMSSRSAIGIITIRGPAATIISVAITGICAIEMRLSRSAGSE